MSLIAIAWLISHHKICTASAPQMEATIVNDATFAREFVVGSAQSPARQRFWLGPGQARTVRYGFVGQANLAIAEMRAGCVVWETRAGAWSTDRRAATATVQKFGIGNNGDVHLLSVRNL